MAVASGRHIDVFVTPDPAPGADLPGSRLPNAVVRIWRETPGVGPVIAEAAMNTAIPGAVMAAWSADEDAHEKLCDAMETWKQLMGVGEGERTA